MLRILRNVARVAFVLVLLAVVGGAAAVGLTLYKFSRDLPDFQQITGYVPATGSKVYAADGALIAEFETEHRIPVSLSQVPPLVVRAFLAAEDRDFYSHKGVDPEAIARAALADVMRFQRGQRPMGASTITQQVVRHFLLNRELSVSRKIKEVLLAYRIEHTLSKDRILEIYLNEIYLGAGSYGVAAAADTYFQKKLDQLTLGEAAFLAALPKAPNNYHPTRHRAAAKARRDWVIAGMAEMGWVGAAQAKTAMAEPLAANFRGEPQREHTGHFTEEVRRELVARFGEKTVYEGGLTIRTSYTQSYQQMAEAAFRKGLVEYDRRHGWRGPIARLGNVPAAQAALATTADPPGIGNWQLAAVTETDANGATIALKSGASGRIPLSELRWARPTIENQRLGRSVRRVSDVISVGDVILVEALAADGGKKGKNAASQVPAYGLRQVPDVSGGLVVNDPKTGRILAMVGGWSFQQSQFNRVTQAKRQPGSAFKPFVYVTALQDGYSPLTMLEDAPIELSQGPGLPPWKPVNYEGSYKGMMTLEDALVHSRNLVTARLATMIGLPAIAKTAQAFDVMDRMPLYYSMSLGAGETTLLRLTNAYAMLDNGGHWLLPSVIDVVQDRDGKVIYQKGVGGCASCFVSTGGSGGEGSNSLYRATGAADLSTIAVPNATFGERPIVYKPTKRDPLLNADAITEIVAIMQGVVERGTGTVVKAVGKPIAGKTGTTSDWFDAWFVGFSPDLAAGVYVGFDEPRTLGDGETGGHVAAPIFRDFMIAALKDKPAKQFPEAPSVGAGSVAVVTGDTDSGGRIDVARRPAGSSQTEVANLEEPTQLYPDPADWADAQYGPAPNTRAARRAPSYPPPAWGYAGQPQAQGYYSGQTYPAGSERDYVATAPAYPAPRYAPPAWGGAYSDGYAPARGAAPAYRAYYGPSYAPPSWGPRAGPGGGTGGLY